jgi:hypothetical protein
MRLERGRRIVAVRHEDEEMWPRSLDHGLEFDPNLACRRSPHEFIEPPVQPRGISFQGRVGEPVASPADPAGAPQQMS